MHLRHAAPDDYAPIIAVIDQWWGGRAVSLMLPRLFFDHFNTTSFVIEADGEIVGFLAGLLSQTDSETAYIHFVGVHPEHRKSGAGRLLYERFFEAARTAGRSTVRAVTSPGNTRSIAFHRAMGFAVEPGSAQSDDGTPYTPHYDGTGEHRVKFVRRE